MGVFSQLISSIIERITIKACDRHNYRSVQCSLSLSNVLTMRCHEMTDGGHIAEESARAARHWGQRRLKPAGSQKFVIWCEQGVTRRCRLSKLTNSAPRIWVQMRRDGGRGCRVSANENSCAHHVTLSPNKLWRSNSKFNIRVRGSGFVGNREWVES
jgi:hypothetical protein